MKKAIVLLVFISILLIGAVSKQYTHQQMGDGSAIVTIHAKTAILGPIDYEKVAEVCKKNNKCSIDKENFTISVELQKGKYYSFSSDYGIPFITHTLELKAIPQDVLTAETRAILQEAGEPVSDAKVDPLELGKKDVALSQFLKNSGDILYVVVMPGEITSATLGTKNGNVLSFTLSEAYATGTPIKITSTEPNISLMAVVLMVLILIAVALLFSKKKGGATVPQGQKGSESQGPRLGLGQQPAEYKKPRVRKK